MGHRYITVALILGMVSLPLSCGGDDDDTTSTGAKGGKGGSAGKAGNGGKAGTTAGGKGGTSGTSGKGGSSAGGTSGKGGSSAGGTSGKGGSSVGGTSGTGGTGNVGNAGGQSGDGAGGSSGTPGSSGAGAGGETTGGNGGNGGEGGAIDPATEARLANATTVCNKPVPNTPDPGCGHVDACIGYMMIPPFGDTGDCLTTYDALLACRAAAPADDFECTADMGVGTYPVDIGACSAENDAAFYCTP